MLQEQTATALNDVKTFKTGATKIVNLVKAKNPNVKVIYNAVWVLKDLSKSDQAKTNKNYETVKKETGGTISYSGNAFINCNAKYSMNLFVDDRHPTAAGSYLSACCLYSTIYKKSPENISYVASLKKETAQKLQTIAAETMGVASKATTTKTTTSTYVSVSANREPRLSFELDNEKYVTLKVYDNAGIDEESLKLYLVSADQKKEIKYSSKTVSKNRKDKYDYVFKIKESLLSTSSVTSFQIKATDGGKTCYINEEFTIRKFKAKSSSGNYFTVNRAPRSFVRKIDNKLALRVIDYSGSGTGSDRGVKKITITTIPVNGKYSVLKTFTSSDIKDGYTATFTSSIFTKSGLAGVSPNLGSNKYKFRIIAEDDSGNKSYKTMIISL